MASADFSLFVVTTADETACETSPVKVRILSLHAPATFTRTSGNLLDFSAFCHLIRIPSLICGSCPSGQRFAYSFFQIPSHGGHPCCSAMCFVVAYAHLGLSPIRIRPCWANKTAGQECFSPARCLFRFTVSGRTRQDISLRNLRQKGSPHTRCHTSVSSLFLFL